MYVCSSLFASAYASARLRIHELSCDLSSTFLSYIKYSHCSQMPHTSIAKYVKNARCRERLLNIALRHYALICICCGTKPRVVAGPVPSDHSALPPERNNSLLLCVILYLQTPPERTQPVTEIAATKARDVFLGCRLAYCAGEHLGD